MQPLTNLKATVEARALAAFATAQGIPCEFHVEPTPRGFYAAFRTPGADELTPELGWGEGRTQAEAIADAIESFDENNQ